MGGHWKISPGEVHLWVAETNAFSDPALLHACAPLLDDDELETLGKLRVQSKRNEFLTAHALLRTTLSHYSNVDPHDWRFRRRKYGKPEVSAPPVTSPPRFNLSHADGLAVCAIACGPVGVDVEQISSSIPAAEIAERFFTPEEAKSLVQLAAEDALQRFFELWTLKEAFSKALGCGITIGFDRFRFIVEDGSYPKFPAILDCLRPQDPSSKWNFVLLRPFPSHIVALATQGLSKVTVRLGGVQSTLRHEPEAGQHI